MNNVTCGDMSSHLAITLSERSPTFKVRSSRVRSDDPPTLFSVVQGFLRSSRSSGPALRGSSTNRLEVELADGTSRSSKPMSSRKDARPSVPGSVRAVPLKHLVHRWWLSHKSVLTLPDRSVTPIDSGCGMSECEADALYARSQPVARMDKFVSHSWACGGKLKALALLHDQQRTLAIAVANGVWLVGSSIAIAIFAAAARRTGEPPTPMHRWMAFSLFVLVPTGLFFVVFLLDLPCRGGPRCFFDRVCIHQRDPLLKAQGIASLGECIECADRLLVLWSSDYFRRLWCVFELACFWHAHGLDQMDLEPVWLPPFLLLLNLLSVLEVTIAAVLWETGRASGTRTVHVASANVHPSTAVDRFVPQAVQHADPRRHHHPGLRRLLDGDVPRPMLSRVLAAAAQGGTPSTSTASSRRAPRLERRDCSHGRRDTVDVR